MNPMNSNFDAFLDAIKDMRESIEKAQIKLQQIKAENDKDIVSFEEKFNELIRRSRS